MTAVPQETLDLLASLTDEELDEILPGLPSEYVEIVLESLGGAGQHGSAPTPLALAKQLDPKYRSKPHLDYLSDRLAQAVRDVEAGQNRFITISMPPRHGKSYLTSTYFPAWVLKRHPDWKIGMLSNESNLATNFGRSVKKLVERPDMGLDLAQDVRAASEWATSQGGSLLSRGISGSFVGRGFKVCLMDDVIKGISQAHSPKERENVWNKWLGDVYTRLEPPYLVVAIGTRWHADDYIGRLLSKDFEGDPSDWEVISLPAIATEHDVIGREPGDPLYNPQLEETREEALERWEKQKRAVGSYVWSALYQQRPAPSEGAIFNVADFRYWTTDKAKADASLDGKIVYFDPTSDEAASGKWLDSWDMAFKGTDASDYVVGQRWVRVGTRRYLVDQIRERMTFTRTLTRLVSWAVTDPSDEYPDPLPTSRFIHRRLIEEKANGAAVIDVIKDKISGVKAINPRDSKEARARAVTPEVEAGDVVLPLPSDPGNEWVQDLLSELRDFPHGEHDDQVDAMDQALMDLRDAGVGGIHSPVGANPLQRNWGGLGSGRIVRSNGR